MEKMLVTSIFSFSHNVSYSSQHKFQFLSRYYLSSANALNLDWFKIFPFGKELSTLREKALEKIVGEKEKMMAASIFSFSHNV